MFINKILTATLLTCLLFSTVPPITHADSMKTIASQPPLESPHEIIIKYKKGKVTKSQGGRLSHKKVHFKKKYPVSQLEVYSVDKTQNTETVIKELIQNPEIEYAEPNYPITFFDTPQDPLISSQWGIQNTGQKIQSAYGTATIDANVAPLWKHTTGKPSVLIGILDAGTDITHPDLKDNIYTNPYEIPDNNIDDDNNGFIDDIHGWDFGNDDNTLYDIGDTYHGTHVAGIAAARSNDLGICGVAPSCKIMPLKFYNNRDMKSYTSDAIEAIEYARCKGVDIINCSWGSYSYSRALWDAIENSHMLFVCAAGNESQEMDKLALYPACFPLPNILSVANMDYNGNLVASSNYGRLVDLAAPGSMILSTLPEGSYGYRSGTSMAAPFVSGIAALLRSSDYMDAVTLANTILAGVRKLPSLEGKVSTGGCVDGYTAYTLLLGLPTPTPRSLPTATPTPTCTNTPTSTPTNTPTNTPSPTISPTPTHKADITLPFVPYDTVKDPEAPQLYLVDKENKKLWSYNLDSKSLASISFDFEPWSVSIYNGEIYVGLSVSNYPRNKGAVAILDKASFTVIQQIYIPLNPLDIAAAKDGNLYVLGIFNACETCLCSFSRSSGQELARESTGRGSALTYLPLYNRLYVLSEWDRDVCSYNLNSQGALYHGSISLGHTRNLSYNKVMKFTPDNRFLYSSNGSIYYCAEKSRDNYANSHYLPQEDLTIAQFLPFSYKDIEFDCKNNLFYTAIQDKIYSYSYDSLKPLGELSLGGSAVFLHTENDRVFCIQQTENSYSIHAYTSNEFAPVSSLAYNHLKDAWDSNMPIFQEDTPKKAETLIEDREISFSSQIYDEEKWFSYCPSESGLHSFWVSQPNTCLSFYDENGFTLYSECSGTSKSINCSLQKDKVYYIEYDSREIAIGTFGLKVLSLATPASPTPTTATPTPSPILSTPFSKPMICGYVCPDFPYLPSEEGLVKKGFCVEIEGTNLNGITNEKGYFEISLPLGSNSSPVLLIKKPHYLPRRIENVDLQKSPLIFPEASPIIMWAGDLIEDQVITMSDIMAEAIRFNTVSGLQGYTNEGDINCDNAINMADILIVAKTFGKKSSDYPSLFVKLREIIPLDFQVGDSKLDETDPFVYLTSKSPPSLHRIDLESGAIKSHSFEAPHLKPEKLIVKGKYLYVSLLSDDMAVSKNAIAKISTETLAPLHIWYVDFTPLEMVVDNDEILYILDEKNTISSFSPSSFTKIDSLTLSYEIGQIIYHPLLHRLYCFSTGHGPKYSVELLREGKFSTVCQKNSEEDIPFTITPEGKYLIGNQIVRCSNDIYDDILLHNNLYKGYLSAAASYDGRRLYTFTKDGFVYVNQASSLEPLASYPTLLDSSALYSFKNYIVCVGNQAAFEYRKDFIQTIQDTSIDNTTESVLPFDLGIHFENPDKATLTWSTTKPVISQIMYSEWPYPNIYTPFEETPSKEHSITLYNLKPDTYYSFQIIPKDGNNIKENAWFVTTGALSN